jgi:hypothetical protein
LDWVEETLCRSHRSLQPKRPGGLFEPPTQKQTFGPLLLTLCGNLMMAEQRQQRVRCSHGASWLPLAPFLPEPIWFHGILLCKPTTLAGLIFA